MASIKINGKDSYDDFNALLTKRSISPPTIRDISETIPYRNGDICFTYQNGKPAYDTRSLTYTFEFVDYPKEKLRADITAFENWILNQGVCEIYDSSDFYHYFARPLSCKESEKGFKCEVTVSFNAQPYKRSDDFSDIPFDEFNFNSDYLNPTEITLNAVVLGNHQPPAELKIYSYADRPIRPRLSYRKSADDTDKQGFTSFWCNGNEISDNCYRETENEFEIDGVVLEPGVNTLNAYGYGSLTVRLVEEVL